MSWNTCQYDGCHFWARRSDGIYCSTHERTIAKKKENDLEFQHKKKQILSQPTAPRAKPNKVSEKRKEQNVEYFKLVEQFKKDNTECKAKVNEFCTDITEDPHHRKGRGIYLMDVSTWLPVCRSCHIFLEAHPKEAKEKGLSESRLATVKQTI